MIRRSEAGVLPQLLGDDDRVEIDRGPPSRLVSMPVEGAMMGAAERDCELIADPAAQSARLHKSQVMGVATLPSADEARLPRHEL